MKSDVASLRSWWLGTVVLWAAAIAVATAFGLGARIAPADPGERSAPALPVLAAAAPERMAAPGSYADIAARPLFAEDRRPRPYLLGGSEPGASTAVRLTGVLLTPQFGMAILTTEQNQSIRLRLNGEAVNGWQLLALEQRTATVSGPGGVQNLELPVFNGQGGEPPTVLGSTAAGADGSASASASAAARPPSVVPAPPPALTPPSPGAQVPAARATTGDATAAPTPQGPSEDQMKAIRERIQARRQQLQQQQSQRPPAGGSSQNP